MSAIAQQNSRFSPIMRLPTELLDATLSMVPPEDIETSSLVSHQWRRASLRYVFSEVTIDLTDDARNFAACNEFIKKQVATKEDIAPFIKVLKVGGIFFNKPVLDVDVLLKTVERLPCLRSLELEHVSIVVSTPSSSIQGLNRHRDIHSVTMRGVKTLNESPYEGVISVLCSFSRISSLEFIGFEDKLGKMKGSEHAEVPLWSGPGPAVSRLVITHHLPLAVFLPILAPASGSTLSHLEISCRSLTDLKAAGDFLRDTGTNLVSLILDIWRLNMVKNERYLISESQIFTLE
ncbi:hypothetical protein BDW22DRAFT_603159 [Trametopsis cervina]|nr:hypothetical protein BDW22DRAFT_603159 [Trametopsis cervina]